MVSGLQAQQEYELEERIKEEWEKIYADTPPGLLPWERGEPEPELVMWIKKGAIRKEKALDVGCGLGTNSIYLAQEGFEVTAIDISKTAVETARSRASRLGLSIEFIVGNAYRLDFPDASFDFVLDRGCFHHIPIERREVYIEGIRRVLKDDGSYLMSCFGDRNDWNAENVFSKARIKRYFSQLFDIRSIRSTTHREPGGTLVHIYSVFMRPLELFNRR